jgi:hypothetical protein
MNDGDPELMEAKLRRLTPARPPAELMARLAAARPAPAPVPPQPSTSNPQLPGLALLRWLGLVAAGAAVAAAFLVWWPSRPENRQASNALSATAEPALKADDVEIDQQLVAAFDAVARLPDGQPVRFRCREWAEEVVLTDTARGIVIEQRTPRLEVVPVSFETY